MDEKNTEEKTKFEKIPDTVQNVADKTIMVGKTLGAIAALFGVIISLKKKK